uniref:Uncharacterized protein n=1 Tax=Pelodiscus sinensis TaxID=13735 RepID=K7GBU4_PELSI
LTLLSPSPQISGDRYEGEVRAYEVLARGAAQEPEGWRHGVAGVRDAVSKEKQKVKEERRKKIETFSSSRLRLESLQDLEAIVKQRQHKKRLRRVVRPKEPEPEPKPAVKAAPVDAARFLQAVRENQVPLIDKYLADGGDPNAHDQVRAVAFDWAGEGGQGIQCAGACKGSVACRGWLEATPLLWACRGGHLQILTRLLDRGAKVSVRDKLRSTALHVAVRTGHCDCAEHLIACGADLDAQDKEGDTPIHDAIRLGRFKAVKTLLLYGANLSIRNQEGLSPVDLVKDWQRGIRQTLQAVLAPPQGRT